MEQSSKLTTTKTITRFVVARCVGMIVSTIAKNSVLVETKTQKVQVFIGAHVLGAMVGDYAGIYVNRTIDMIAEGLAKRAAERENQTVAK